MCLIVCVCMCMDVCWHSCNWIFVSTDFRRDIYGEILRDILYVHHQTTCDPLLKKLMSWTVFRFHSAGMFHYNDLKIIIWEMTLSILMHEHLKSHEPSSSEPSLLQSVLWLWHQCKKADGNCSIRAFIQHLYAITNKNGKLRKGKELIDITNNPAGYFVLFCTEVISLN